MRVFPDGDLADADRLDLLQEMLANQEARLTGMEGKRGPVDSAPRRKAMLVLGRETSEQEKKQ